MINQWSTHGCVFHRWFRQHEYIEKLNMQAILNATAMHDVFVKDLLVSYGKVRSPSPFQQVLPSPNKGTVNVIFPFPLQIPVLVHEMIIIEVWKHNVFPILCQLRDFKPKNTFHLYMVVSVAWDVKLWLVHSVSLIYCLLDPPRSYSHKPPGNNHVSQGKNWSPEVPWPGL